MNITDKLNSGTMLLRVLAYGPAKSKKTWWAGLAAEAGFNVIVLDGDCGWQIFSNIAEEGRKHITVFEMQDAINRPIYANALTRFLKAGKLTWDEKARKVETLNPNENCISLNLSMLTSQTVLVIDSWTALANSLLLQHAKENSIDLTDPEKSDWDYYRWAGQLCTWMLTQLQALPCHIIVIGHTTVYEKRSKDGKKIEWARRQPMSTSGPAAMQMAKFFSDILYFYVKGTAFKIDTTGADDKDGGSRIVPPKVYAWDELQFRDLCKAGGIQLPNNQDLLNFSPATPAELKTAKPGVIEKRTGGLKLAIKPAKLITNRKLKL